MIISLIMSFHLRVWCKRVQLRSGGCSGWNLAQPWALHHPDGWLQQRSVPGFGKQSRDWSQSWWELLFHIWASSHFSFCTTEARRWLINANHCNQIRLTNTVQNYSVSVIRTKGLWSFAKQSKSSLNELCCNTVGAEVNSLGVTLLDNNSRKFISINSQWVELIFWISHSSKRL